MGLTDNLLNTWQLLLTGALFLAGFFWAFRRADWARLRADQALQHSFFGAAVVLGFLWQLRAGVLPGLSIHIGAMTVVTLMLGWALAVYVGLMALGISLLTGAETLANIPATALMTVVLPAMVSHGVMLWERNRGFRNFFAYIFVCSFFGAGLAFAVGACAMVGLLWLSGAYSGYELMHDYLRYLPLIVLPEALINGVVVTSLMVSYPERLLTLDQRRYL